MVFPVTRLIARNSDRFIALFTPVEIGRSNCVGFLNSYLKSSLTQLRSISPRPARQWLDYLLLTTNQAIGELGFMMEWTVKTTNLCYCHFRTGNHSQRGFAIPSVPVGKGRFGSQSSLLASQSGSHGSQSDLSQTDSNPELNGSGRKLSSQSSPDHTPRRGSASDKYVFRQNNFENKKILKVTDVS